MILLNGVGYNPQDDDSDTDYKRPPRDAACVLDYFCALSFVENDGQFATDEMYAMLADPTAFFGADSDELTYRAER